MLEKQVAEIVGDRWLIGSASWCLAINLFCFLASHRVFLAKVQGRGMPLLLRFLLDDSLVVGCRGGVFTRHTLKLGSRKTALQVFVVDAIDFSSATRASAFF